MRSEADPVDSNTINIRPEINARPEHYAMLRIRNEQMAVFEDAGLQALKERMFRVLQENWSNAITELGEHETRRWIMHGFSCARNYGIDTERGLCRFVSLMFFLGYDFHTDPDLPWARTILDAAELSPREKLDRLTAYVYQEFGGTEEQ